MNLIGFFFRAGASQGDRGYFHMFFTMDCWQFFLSAFEDNADIIVSYVNRKICHNRSSFDLRQEKVRILSVLDVVTINTTEGLWSLCSIMGSCFGVGVRKKFLR